MIFLFRFIILLVFFIFPFASIAQDYKWDNVAVGGGGYIIGIAQHPKNPELIYIRTDVGGVYKWNPGQKRMQQLMNWIPFEKSNLYGIAGLALDPSDTNIVYLAAGKYKGVEPSDVLKSSDRGSTWMRMHLNKTFGGNSHPNRKGNPLVVNPHQNNELWAGTLGEGLWKFSGKNWEHIESVPSGESIRAVVFDQNNKDFIYVGVRGEGVFRSIDGGEIFNKVGEAPVTISDMSLSKDGNILYISAWDKGIFRLSDARNSMEWQDISAPAKGNRTVTASPHENNVVMTFGGEYGALDQFFVSRDGGQNWTQHLGTAKRHIPWHPPGYAGSAVSQIAFDSRDPKKVYFTDWYSIYYTNNWEEPPVVWSNEMGVGHEEVVTAVLSPAHPQNPAGVLFYSGSADVGGFSHTALRQFPLTNFKTMVTGEAGENIKDFTEVTGLDFAESDASFMVAVGGSDWEGTLGSFGYSIDGGKTMQLSSGYHSNWGDGRVAIAGNDKNNILVSTKSGVKYSDDAGLSFKEALGAPDSKDLGVGGIFNYRHTLASDRVNGNFYLFSLKGAVYKSSDGGKNFHQIGKLPVTESKKIYLKAVPYHENDLWIALGNEGLWHSEDGGSNWKKLENIKDASLLAFGKEAPGFAFPAIFIWGKLLDDDEYWFYRSDDGGESWNKINDMNNRIGNATQAMAADLKVFGRVYVGTNGSGIWYGEPVK